MDKEWTYKNKQMQILNGYPEKAFYQMPFAKAQEILGQDIIEGLRILEEN